MTDIEWCQNEDGTKGKTWNPVRGCSRVSKGCDACYAMRFAHRFSNEVNGKPAPYQGLTTIRNGKVDWTGFARLHPEMLAEPLKWRKPQRVFVNSMSDLFHESLTNAEIMRVWLVMARCPQHTFQILTKRPRIAASRTKRPVPYVLKQSDTSDGYYCVGLSGGGRKQTNHRVHRLIARAFLGEPHPGHVVNHKDFNRKNNILQNLEWVSQGDNVRHTVSAGRLVIPRLAGEQCARAVLNQAQVAIVRRLRGVVPQSQLAILCGISKTAIRLIQLNRNWATPSEVGT